jgi:hypothetical protein
VGGALNVGGAVTATNTWTKVVDQVVNTTNFNIPITTGRVYKIYFNGVLTGLTNQGTAPDTRLLLRFTSAASYRSFLVFDGDGTGGEFDTSGVYLLRNVWGRYCGVSGEFTVSAGTYTPFTHVVGLAMVDDSTYGSASGVWGIHTAGWAQIGNPSNMQLVTVGTAAFVGHLTVFQVGP